MRARLIDAGGIWNTSRVISRHMKSAVKKSAVKLQSLVIMWAIAAALGGCVTPPTRMGETRTNVGSNAEHAASPAATVPPPSPTGARPEFSLGPPDFSALLEPQGAAVVSVSAVKIISIDRDDEHADEDEQALAEFLRHRGFTLVQGKPQRAALRDQGCGIIVSHDGYILTNAHVVSEASWMTVRLPDDREFAARLVGLDPLSDIAVLQIEAHDLPVVTLGEAARLRPGMWVAAIGAPFGLKDSITAGVVSALGRTLPGDEAYLPFIQTDLPLNPGNSGGPLFDERGEVVGINSQIVLNDSNNAHVSFAVPIEIARNIEEQLISRGRVVRGDIGIAFQDVDSTLTRAFGLDGSIGALVHTVEPGGPANQANVRSGDIILELDGRRIARASELAGAITALRPGSTAVLGIWRDHAFARIPVRIEEAKSPHFQIQQAAGLEPMSPSRLLSVRELSAKDRRAIGTDGHLMVTSVSVQAAAAGIGTGDIVLSAGATSLRTASEFRQTLVKSSEVLALLIEHDGVREFVALRLDYPDRKHTTAAEEHKRR